AALPVSRTALSGATLSRTALATSAMTGAAMTGTAGTTGADGAALAAGAATAAGTASGTGSRAALGAAVPTPIRGRAGIRRGRRAVGPHARPTAGRVAGTPGTARTTGTRFTGSGGHGGGRRGGRIGGRVGRGRGRGPRAARGAPFPASGRGVHPIAIAHTGSFTRLPGITRWVCPPMAQDCQDSSPHIWTSKTSPELEMNTM